MRIVVATGFAPFAASAHDELGDRLAQALRDHRPADLVERVRLPLGPGFGLAAALTDVVEGSDRLIAVGEDAARLHHPSRRIWLPPTDAAADPGSVDWPLLAAELAA